MQNISNKFAIELNIYSMAEQIILSQIPLSDLITEIADMIAKKIQATNIPKSSPEPERASVNYLVFKKSEDKTEWVYVGLRD